MNIKSFYNSLTRKKFINYEAVGQTELRRCLSTIDLTLVGIGSTLGSGIYVLTGEVARHKTGPAIVISFFIAAFVSVLSGFCYAEFSARVPKAGSAYIYCYLTIGEFCAFIIAWNLLLEYIIGGAAIARSVSAYIDTLAGGLIQNTTLSVTGEVNVAGLSKYIDIFSFLVVMIFTILLSFGIKNSARFNNFCVATNLVTILTIIVVGSFYTDTKNWENFAPFGFQGIIAGSASCFFAFIGFDVIATTSEEAKNPSKSIPISMIGTITVCFLAYFGVSAVVTLMVPYHQLDVTAAIAIAFQQRHLSFMGILIAIGATAGLLGTTLVSLLPSPRLLYALAQDGMFFQIFAKVNSNTGVPVIATVSSGLMIGFMSAVLDLSALVEMLSIGALMAYAIVVICVLILRYQPKQLSQQAVGALTTIKLQAQNIDMNTLDLVNEYIAEEDVSLTHRENADTTCFDGGFTMGNKPLVINTAIIFLILLLIAISLMLSKCPLAFTKDNIPVFVVIAILTLLVFFIGVFLQSCESNNVENLDFKVPFLPWLPIVALFSNIILTLQLDVMTYYRFVVWVSIGFVVYFAYSIRYSQERMWNKENNDSYVLLQAVKKKQRDCDGENTPLVSPVKIQ